MRIPVRTQDRGFAFNITPLIDVVFLLIIFFLVASHFIRNENVERMLLGTTPITPEEFEQRLQVIVAKYGAEKTELRIRADRTVPYVRVEPLLLTAARHGVARVRFAVTRAS